LAYDVAPDNAGEGAAVFPSVRPKTKIGFEEWIPSASVDRKQPAQALTCAILVGLGWIGAAPSGGGLLLHIISKRGHVNLDLASSLVTTLTGGLVLVAAGRSLRRLGRIGDVDLHDVDRS
jgi:hypothetical protein